MLVSIILQVIHINFVEGEISTLQVSVGKFSYQVHSLIPKLTTNSLLNKKLDYLDHLVESFSRSSTIKLAEIVENYKVIISW